MAAEKHGHKAAAPEKDAPVKGPSLPVLDDEGALPADVALALGEAELKAVCKAAGKAFGGITIVGDRAYL